MRSKFVTSHHHRPLSVALGGQARGLTLVELLVAIAVLGLISVLGWRGLDAIARTRQVLNQELAQTRELQLSFAQMQIDCANAVDASTLTGSAPILLESNRISLVRRSQTESQAGGLQLVTWRLNEGILTREESPVTRDLNQINRYRQMAQSSTPTAIRLSTGVQQLSLRIWSDDGRGWRSWQQMSNPIISRGSLMSPETGTTATQTIWRGIEVSLQLSGQTTRLTKIFMLGAV
jgi:general secretion pathway protein J